PDPGQPLPSPPGASVHPARPSRGNPHDTRREDRGRVLLRRHNSPSTLTVTTNNTTTPTTATTVIGNINDEQLHQHRQPK
ncbi:MAG TPA: hypothetical protein VJT72_21715, partial [Pseudonocardiaceae bacterium]|nr:hypothetical protein [Pseudonocardiaceae bacterium]